MSRLFAAARSVAFLDLVVLTCVVLALATCGAWGAVALVFVALSARAFERFLGLQERNVRSEAADKLRVLTDAIDQRFSKVESEVSKVSLQAVGRTEGYRRA